MKFINSLLKYYILYFCGGVYRAKQLRELQSDHQIF